MRDFSLGYDLHGEHFGLGVSLSEPPERFGVREWRRDHKRGKTVFLERREILVEKTEAYPGLICFPSFYDVELG